MKKLIFIFLFIFTSCSAHKFVSQKSLPSQIKEIINNTDPNVNIGIKIMSLADNKTIYELNSNRHFVPASTIKLATVLAALYYLRPSYRFNTNILTESFDAKSGFVNNLYLQGSGDPSL